MICKPCRWPKDVGVTFIIKFVKKKLEIKFTNIFIFLQGRCTTLFLYKVNIIIFVSLFEAVYKPLAYLQ